ncbi:YlbE-like family protein [Fictibacillus nanhaiensis]|uniref:YlbE-like family protein n=1 Tax=Fictibacillus nanhaiensis TaxID=742169 RepID=UPI001C9790A6|nr:YlbE-like family protein [Fictibacillus nanhaiensis]MBY6036218.1 YlbE-like family protein [Fictibacillus nanhaiensis]
MRREIQEYLNTRPDLKYYIREKPEWYRKLSRNPFSVSELEEGAKVFYGRTFGQRVDRFHQQVQNFGLLMELISVMGDEKQEGTIPEGFNNPGLDIGDNGQNG